MKLPDLSSKKFRWVALLFLALGLAIVIIDNTVLNVAIPYILRDLHTTFDGIQWVVSGYALIIATLLITVGRLGDVFGRKKIFLLGTVFFAVGSFIASISLNVFILFLGEALIEAIGASMMLTSSLSLLVSEFEGRERPIAFGIWGSVAGASATVGPLLGGFLTTYYSWRWSLRINVAVAVIAILGSVFIQECFGEKGEKFDFVGTILSGIGLFALIFGFIEGQRFGWWAPVATLSIFSWTWPFQNISIIPFAFNFAVIFLLAFIGWETYLENKGRQPLVRLSLFGHSTFSIGLIALFILALGQFGTFFILPIYLQIVLGLTAFQTGLVFISASLTILIVGPLTGFIASRVGSKWIITVGMICLGIGTYVLGLTLSTTISPWSLTPSLMIFGIGIGAGSSQLTNVILSGVPANQSGEASAVNNTIRQVGTSIGIAIIGVIFSNVISSHIPTNITADRSIPTQIKPLIIQNTKSITPESGQEYSFKNVPSVIENALKNDINQSIVTASKATLFYSLFFTFGGAVASLFIPSLPLSEKKEESDENAKHPKFTPPVIEKKESGRREHIIFQDK